MTKSSIRKKILAIENVLIERGVASKSNVQGCNSTELTEIEKDAGCDLPIAYREFLTRMGRRAGNFYVGTDMFYSAIIGLTNAARMLVAEDSAGVSLPEDAVAFSMHQGYQFLFFRATEGGDPPVYYYMEQSGKFEKKANKLTEFLLQVAHDEW